MKFRSDINGLRAIAVAAVILFHFAVPGFSGGFVGVDIFFVISGYLMTSIVVPKVVGASFSLTSFYLSRVKRIIPALTVLCFCLLVVGWKFLFPSDFRVLGKHVVAALLFGSNVVFGRESGYFDSSPFDKWLLHTWSLSVEWQFYLIYPAVIIGAFKLGGAKIVRWVIIGLFLLSLSLSVLISKTHPVEAFYLIHTRAWELLAGGIVFLYPIKAKRRPALFVETVGLVLIASAVVLFSEKSAWPGYAAGLPVAGTMLVLWADRAVSIVTSNRASQFLGSVSYSAYLWHWPIVVYVNYAGLMRNPIAVSVGIVASIALAWLSYSTVEKRQWIGYRTETAPIWRQLFVNLSAPFVVMLISGAVLLANGVPQQFRSINSSERLKFVEYYRNLHQNGLDTAYRSECDFYDWKTKRSKRELPATCTQAQGESAVFLWGDSHAQALSLGLRTLVGERYVSQVATSGCPPGLDGRTLSPIDNNCLGSNQYALAQIARLKPGTVVLAQVNLHASKDWNRVSAVLHSIGVRRVIIVGPQPAWNPELPALVARNHWLDMSEYIDDGIHKETIAADLALRKTIEQNGNATYVSMTDILCRSGACRAFLPGTRDLMVVDSGHLSPQGSIFVAKHAFMNLALPSPSERHAGVR
jgi:peptidoglycan/LPS O-acetylase OafA/YrhL